MSEQVALKEYIHSKMDILFVALNAPENSNRNTHWFTNNLSFWNLLYRTGIITKKITDKLKGDITVFCGNKVNYKNWIIGVTDLNRRDVETDSRNVKVTISDVHRILNIVRDNDVSKVCLMHSKVGKAFRDYASEITFNHHRYGKIGTYKETEIFEVPFHNASVPNKEQYYTMLIKGDVPNTKPKQPKKEKFLKTKSKIVLPDSQPDSKEFVSFIIPKVGNSITAKDIAKGQLRITVDFKKYFPSQNQVLNIKYLGKNKQVSFIFRESRSYILFVGKEFMALNSIDSRSRIKVTMVEGKYILSKV